MTPVTPEQATFIAGFLSTSPVASNAIYSLASQIKSAEACYEAREEEAHQLSERIIKLTKERDAMMAEVVYEKARKTIWQQQYEAAIEQRNTLAAAAKLALDSLSVSYPTDRRRLQAHNAAIEALRQAGVQ